LQKVKKQIFTTAKIMIHAIEVCTENQSPPHTAEVFRISANALSPFQRCPVHWLSKTFVTSEGHITFHKEATRLVNQISNRHTKTLFEKPVEKLKEKTQITSKFLSKFTETFSLKW